MSEPRKVVQLSSVIDGRGKYLVLALCNDGTIWQLDGLYEGAAYWEPFPVPPIDPMEELTDYSKKIPPLDWKP